jgi:DNA-binding transcriptional MerR regulator
VSTGELARALGLSISSIKRYISQGKITPELRSGGGHYRWRVEDVRRQLRELAEQRRRDESD